MFFRCDIITKSESTSKFLQNLSDEYIILLKHDFIKKSQFEFLESKKMSIKNGEYIVCLDFAENYTCIVQDAIQSHHWATQQATLHPYTIYYKKNGKLEHLNFVAISEYVNHDASCVNLFNEKMIAHLTSIFGKNNVKKIYYFSDGAGSQYKNKYNFINLAYHKKDFGVHAEWHFFATSHGKGPCDGLGGTVKRLALKASKQKIPGSARNDRLSTPEKLFNWAIQAFKSIQFCFLKNTEHVNHEKKLSSRYSKAITITNTRQYHCFIPKSNVKIACKKFSSDKSSILSPIAKTATLT